MKIDIIIGPMFSGKSSELKRRCGRYMAIDKKVLVINSILDSRSTKNTLSCHDESIATKDSFDVLKIKTLMSIIHSTEFNKAEVIGIDESQFFDDLYTFVIFCEQKNKSVIIVGLDGDSERKPFGQILQCIPLCDTVVKLHAYDMISKDGSDAIFSKKLTNVNNSDTICIGAQDKYVAVSRKNYLTNPVSNNSRDTNVQFCAFYS
jgi:thymidine kinase